MDTSSATNWLTLILAVATVWLAVATQRMAKATQMSIQLQSTPYLAIKSLVLELITFNQLGAPAPVATTRLYLVLSNPGQVLVGYQVEKMDVTFNGASITNPQFHSKGGVIHPKNDGTFFHPPIGANAPIQPGQEGDVNLKISYWSTPNKRNHVEARIGYVLKSLNPVSIDWIYLDGPDYS